MVDHEDVGLVFFWFEFEAGLLLDGGEEAGCGVGVVEVGVVGCKCEGEVVAAGEAVWSSTGLLESNCIARAKSAMVLLMYLLVLCEPFPFPYCSGWPSWPVVLGVILGPPLAMVMAKTESSRFSWWNLMPKRSANSFWIICCSWQKAGSPAASGTPSMSNRSVSNHAGAPTIWVL